MNRMKARELSVTLLGDRLGQDRFQDWTETETRHLPVTPEMRRARAVEIAMQLNDTDKWHGHGRGISQSAWQQDLGLKIDALDSKPVLCDFITQYDALLADSMLEQRQEGVLRSAHKYLPLAYI